ncbi:cancer-related nucleoside-triphosphatase [Anopheles nili]|uniref:cancer-related nucleoside-triphosphatase n=1 Tax=Anopheles nili TaxID=185578 RepID=UPI00237C1633|nr:cancer-related nucleoside-triphosphatase [Anopheles nili]
MSLILVTGMPGVGKTTLMCKLSNELSKRNIPISGFYTEEVRDSRTGDRVGFDIVTFAGGRAPLARTGVTGTRSNCPTVGRYSVCLSEFERLALPALEQRDKGISASDGVLLLDEIGRMEMKSSAFATRMNAIVEEIIAKKVRFIATVPLKSSGIDVIERLKRIPGCQLFHVKPSNRDQMYCDVENAALLLHSRR